jgi:1,2-diacylglycerol 3-alpha-glucosyltransferase
MRLVVMFNNFGPYHLARVSAAIARGRQERITVFGLEVLGRSATYAWTPRNGVETGILTLFPASNNRTISSPLIFSRVWAALNSLQADCVAIPGYKSMASIAAFLWAKVKGKTAIMMSESSRDDLSRDYLKEWLKRQIVRQFHGALVGGTPQKEYAASLGIPREKIFLGYDVVDNEHFARGAAAIRRKEKFYRRQVGLPGPYFLTVSRFIAKKNLPFLLEAYRSYRLWAAREPWDLVVCGSGPLEASLQEQARGIAGVHFPGFKQVDQLPIYYGLAGAFILPSSHFEQWGLVVNEAMASGLPVLVSRACGCSHDLVRPGINGYTFNPFITESLTALMLKISSGVMDLEAMGRASQEIIAAWAPETFAENLLNIIKTPGHTLQREK